MAHTHIRGAKKSIRRRTHARGTRTQKQKKMKDRGKEHSSGKKGTWKRETQHQEKNSGKESTRRTLFEQHIPQWYILADGDSSFNVGPLLELLQGYDENKALMVGQKYDDGVGSGYMTGGAGVHSFSFLLLNTFSFEHSPPLSLSLSGTHPHIHTQTQYVLSRGAVQRIAHHCLESDGAGCAMVCPS